MVAYRVGMGHTYLFSDTVYNDDIVIVVSGVYTGEEWRSLRQWKSWGGIFFSWGGILGF